MRSSACGSCATSLFLPHFDVNCDLLMNRDTATCILFVKRQTNGSMECIACFHMTSWRPYFCPKTMKRRPCLCPNHSCGSWTLFLYASFVPVNLHRWWPREWKHRICSLIQRKVKKWHTHICLLPLDCCSRIIFASLSILKVPTAIFFLCFFFYSLCVFVYSFPEFIPSLHLPKAE